MDHHEPTWDDAVARLDATDHRSASRVRRDIVRAAAVLAASDHAAAAERRHVAGLAACAALAAYRLAGGTPAHLAMVAGDRGRGRAATADDVTGSVGDRAAVARQCLDLDSSDLDASTVIPHLDQRAADLDQPRYTPDGGHLADLDQRTDTDVDHFRPDPAHRAERAAALERIHSSH